MKTRMLISLALCSPAPFGNTADFSAMLDSHYDSNLVNSPVGTEILAGPIIELSAMYSATLSERPFSELTWQTQTTAKKSLTYADIGHINLSTGITKQWQTRAGYRAPWYSLHSDLAIELNQLTEHHSLFLQADIARSKRLTDKFVVTLKTDTKYRVTEQSALNGFRTKIGSYVDWQATPSLALYNQLSAGYGHIVSSYHGALTRSHHLGSQNGAPSGSVYFEDASLSSMMNEPWYTYGFSGFFGGTTLGINWPLNSSFSVDAAYRIQLESRENLTYNKQSAFISLLFLAH